jgi:transposase
VVGVVPQGHGKTTTFVAALTVAGLTAPMVIDGAMNGDLFVAYVEPVLVPSLRAGDVVVMDTLWCHKRARVRQLIAGWAVRFCSCRRTAPTSTPSSWPSPSSRRC